MAWKEFTTDIFVKNTQFIYSLACKFYGQVLPTPPQYMSVGLTEFRQKKSNLPNISFSSSEFRGIICGEVYTFID